MTTEQQAYIEGFVKRASEYGFSEEEAINILKAASELKGDQHKLDVDKDGKIEAEDLKKLRQRKQAAEAGEPSLQAKLMGKLPKFLQNSNVMSQTVTPKDAYKNVFNKQK